MEKQNHIILDRLDRIEKFLKFNKKNLSVEETAFYLDLSVSYVYKLCHQGKLAYSKPNGKKIYFSKESLDNWMSQNQTNSDSQIEEEAIKRTL